MIIFLASFGATAAQQVEFFNGTNFPASPSSGDKEVNYLIESQIIYPTKELEIKQSQEVFVVVKVSWEGKIDTIFANLEKDNLFVLEAIRLVKLIVWQKDEIRKGKRIGEQQIKITFDPKKYNKAERRRPAPPITTEDATIFIKSQVDKAPSVKNYKSINEYVTDNVRYPALALQQLISGTVKVVFVIEKNGVASNFKITKPLAGGCNEETIRLLKNIIWKPAIKEGEPVRTFSDYTLTFMHPGNTYR
ncbi:energy transducer TonB [Vicingaceae bacterium]|nr:energy transducer TonB [Vicingaceae bacterium]MDC1452062.1 energy transducer TonB [Vicingaceae bacterium]